MSQPSDSTRRNTPDREPGSGESNTWAFVLPFAVMMLVIMFYPKFDPSIDAEAFPDLVPTAEDGSAAETIDYVPDAAKTQKFMLLLGAQIVIAAGFFVYFRKIYLSQFPLRASWLSVVFGIIGAVIWIGLCELQIESAVMQSLGISEKSVARPAFNPFAMIADDPTRAMFFAVRFGVLVIVVPFVEELFLRGWLVRWWENPDFYLVSLSAVSMTGVLVATGYGVLAHPAEAIAAIAWFSFISWLMLKTGNLWDCVIAHAVTNLLLGLYVLYFEAWRLW